MNLRRNIPSKCVVSLIVQPFIVTEENFKIIKVKMAIVKRFLQTVLKIERTSLSKGYILIENTIFFNNLIFSSLT